MMNRRTLIKAMAAAGVATPLVSSMTGCATARTQANPSTGKPRVVVIGGGFGGATAAKYVKRFGKDIDVTMVEKKASYMTCPASNWYLADLISAKEITQDYKALANNGINVMQDTVTKINAAAKEVELASGKVLGYDRLVVSPGIDFKWDEVEGVDAQISDAKIPHAYQAGPQTELLHKQLHAMKQGGTFCIVPPGNPFRCPPGPYERISLVADFLKKNNPTAKILVLDQKAKFSKFGLFKEGWEELYGDMIEWVGKMDGGKVSKIDANTMTVTAEAGEFKADVINFIPNQKAGKLAFDAGLTDKSGWCPVNQRTFESKIHAGIHVIGDSSIAGKMPKSGHSASSQAKMCAAAIVSSFNGWKVPAPKNVNTCYSLVGANYGISVVAVYEMKDDGTIGKVKGAGGVSPMGETAAFHKMEANYARGWYKSIAADIWQS